MQVLRELQELCIALIVIHTGAELTLTVVTPLDTVLINGLSVDVDVECGSKVVFVCEIKPYVDTAIWQVNSTTYALCLVQNCFNYPPYPAHHDFSMSLTTETFNLTTDPITLAARRNIYSCSDGLTALSVDAIVKAYVKNETLVMDTSTANQITLTTGCVYPYGKDDMTFEWFISKDRVILQQSQFVRDDVQSITAFACTETSDCAGADTVQLNSTMVVEVFETGDDYFICAAVQHIDEPDRPRAVHCSANTYKIRNYITDGSAITLKFWEILCIILGIYHLIFLQKLILLLCEDDKSNVWIYLAGCVFPALGLAWLIYKHDKPNDKCLYCCSLKLNKWVLCLAVVICVIEIVIIVVFIVLELTQLGVYLPVGILYIVVSCLVTAAIFSCIDAPPRCTKCSNKSGFICKLCKLNYYCKECVGNNPQMTCVCLNCTTCDKTSEFECKLCNKKYCEDCVKHDLCKTDQKKECGLCTIVPKEMKTYCCECKKFLCNSCCATKHVNCNGILLKHPQHNTERESEIFCENKHDTRDSACGYCVKCDCYLCITCLRSHAEHNPLKIQRYLDTDKDRLCCSRDHTDHAGSYPGFCLECQIYICRDCSEEHTGYGHHSIMHILEVSYKNSDSTRKSCQNHADKPAECYSYTKKAFLCSKCFEQGYNHKQRITYPNEDMERHMTKCDLRTHFGEECFNTEAYCLICKICLCMNCYKLHRSFTKHWIQTHTRNTYVCKKCQINGHKFPVQCVDLNTFTISCAECFEGKVIATMETPEDCYTLDETQRLNFSRHPACQTHEFPFSNQIAIAPVRSNVYCFICKVFMCNTCFKKHRRLGSVWLENGRWKLLERPHSQCFEITATRSNWKLCTLIPVAGIFFGIAQCCRNICIKMMRTGINST